MSYKCVCVSTFVKGFYQFYHICTGHLAVVKLLLFVLRVYSAIVSVSANQLVTWYIIAQIYNMTTWCHIQISLQNLFSVFLDTNTFLQGRLKLAFEARDRESKQQKALSKARDRNPNNRHQIVSLFLYLSHVVDSSHPVH